MAQPLKIGLAVWSAPATARVYNFVLLPSVTILPLCGLWVQGDLTQANAAWSCTVSSLLYILLPLTTSLRREKDLREYWGYRTVIEAQLTAASASPAQRHHLLRRLATLTSQYHLALNPAPAMRFAKVLGASVSQLVRLISRF